MSTLFRNVHVNINNSNIRYNVYKIVNPQLMVHKTYENKQVINDPHRISFTWLRVIGHSLVVETGRWNRRGSGLLPIEERLCVWWQSERRACAGTVSPGSIYLKFIWFHYFDWGFQRIYWWYCLSGISCNVCMTTLSTMIFLL